MSNETLLDIPCEYLNFGQILLIKKSSEIVVDGFHLFEPKQRIRESDHLCLIDVEQMNQQKINSKKDFLNSLDEQSEFFQLILEINPEIFSAGKSIEISKSNKIKKEFNLNQLYQIDKNQNEIIQLFIDENDLQRGQTMLIEKDQQIQILNTNQYNRSQMKHFNTNFFRKRDHLQSKNLMEILIELDPEYFINHHRLILKREDSTSISEHFAYHRRQSKSQHDLEIDFKEN